MTKEFVPQPGVQALASLLEYASKRAMVVRAKDSERKYGLTNGRHSAVSVASLLRTLLPKAEIEAGLGISERAMVTLCRDLLAQHAPDQKIKPGLVAAALRDMAALPDGLEGTGFMAHERGRGGRVFVKVTP
jgi:hypothetical protein